MNRKINLRKVKRKENYEYPPKVEKRKFDVCIFSTKAEGLSIFDVYMFHIRVNRDFQFYLWRNPIWWSTALVKRSRNTSPFSALGPRNQAPRAAHCLCLSLSWSPLENSLLCWEYMGAFDRRGRLAPAAASCWAGLFLRAENILKSLAMVTKVRLLFNHHNGIRVIIIVRLISEISTL